MSFEDIQKVTDTEQGVRTKKAEAQAEARQLAANAHKSGAAEVERERAGAEAQVKLLMEQAEARAKKRAEEALQANEKACEDLRRKARAHLDEAAGLIVGKVVEF